MTTRKAFAVSVAAAVASAALAGPALAQSADLRIDIVGDPPDSVLFENGNGQRPLTANRERAGLTYYRLRLRPSEQGSVRFVYDELRSFSYTLHVRGGSSPTSIRFRRPTRVACLEKTMDHISSAASGALDAYFMAYELAYRPEVQCPGNGLKRKALRLWLEMGCRLAAQWAFIRVDPEATRAFRTLPRAAADDLRQQFRGCPIV